MHLKWRLRNGIHFVSVSMWYGQWRYSTHFRRRQITGISDCIFTSFFRLIAKKTLKYWPFVRKIGGYPVESSRKRPLMRKIWSCHDVIMGAVAFGVRLNLNMPTHWVLVIGDRQCYRRLSTTNTRRNVISTRNRKLKKISVFMDFFF